MAVIKINEKNLPAIKVGDSDKAKVGEWVLAIGNPMGFSHTVTAGIISAKGRSNLRLADYENFIQTDAAINPGNSGGALVNLEGKLVGINTAIASQTGSYIGIGFAIPVNMAKDIMDDLIGKGKVVRGWLGVSIQDINEGLLTAMGLKDKAGALVSSVVEDSPAEKAGIRQGDVIIGLNGVKIKDSNHLKNTVAVVDPGQEIAIKVMRNKKVKTFKIKLGEFPEDEKVVQKTTKKQKELLGLAVQSLNKELARQFGYQGKNGVVVTEVVPGSPAAGAGIRPGDIIRELNRKAVKTVADYNNAVKGVRKGDTILFLLERQGGMFFMGVKIPEK
jgi:serine protease Do